MLLLVLQGTGGGRGGPYHGGRDTGAYIHSNARDMYSLYIVMMFCISIHIYENIYL